MNSQSYQYIVTAAIVTYNNEKNELLQAIHSFLQYNGTKLLIIIDHSPTNHLEHIVSDIEHTQYYHHPENKGFGYGHNLAIKKIKNSSKYHLILNPDTEFNGNIVISTLLDYLDNNSNVGLIMPKIVNQEGEIQYLAKLLPTPMDLFVKRFLPKNLSNKLMYRFQLKMKDYNSVFEAPSLSGCFMLITNTVINNVGLFDERFFMYGEDIDFSRRIHAQYTTLYYPLVSITHKHEAASYKNYKMLWIHTINIIRYFNKWGWIWDNERKNINNKILTN